jgi:U3 small nucleolar RNA-associated protein 15
VLVAGDETGRIQVFDVSTRAILKTWTTHQQPVWSTNFSPINTTSLLSASDDKTVRLWDLPSQDPLTTFVGHADYVRAAAFLPQPAAGLFITGSYDQTVRVWDPRAPASAALIFKHAAPVEAVLPLAQGTTVLAAAGNQVSVLDLVAAKPVQLLRNHQKTVTTLALASGGRRVVAGGLDGHVKVFETTAWNVVAGSKYPSPVLSLSVVAAGAGAEDRHVVVGMQSGLLSIKTRLSGEQKVKESEKQKEMQALIEGTLEEFDKKKAKKRRRGVEKVLRNREFIGEGADVVIEGNPRGKQKKEQPWEKDLRHGRYASALDRVLDKVRMPIPNIFQKQSILTLFSPQPLSPS